MQQEQEQQQEQGQEEIGLFLDSIKSKETKEKYTAYLKKYMNMMGLKDPLYENDPRVIERHIIDFIIKRKKEGKSYGAIQNYITTILSFYKIHDIVLNTRKISKFMPENRKVKKDRSYTHQEISKLLEIADERMRVVILLLASTGMRIGAIPSLRVGNLEKLGEVYKVTVYENEKEEYFTFTTPECSKAIDDYLDMRSRYGEKVNNYSFLIREQFDVRDHVKISKCRSVGRGGLQWKLEDIARRCNVRTRQVPLAHGFRKFFTTKLVNSKVNPEIREMLLGHKIGLAGAYYRPTEEEMFQEYEKAIDNLTIDPANRLQRKVEVLTLEKSKVDLALMQIEEMKKRIGLD